MLHITCNMCTRDLPDMYALSPRASGIHIRQIPRAHVTTITCIPEALRAHTLQVICITSVRGRALSSSSLMHTLAELLLYTHLRRFDCGFRISFQEHVLQILSKTSAQKYRQIVSVINIVV